jgi:uncharacterized protein YejL (UPF0352 family)
MHDMDNALDRISELTAVNYKKIAVLGARTMVLGEFHAAVLPHLTAMQRVAISESFREAIEDTMALMDDVPLPAEYHSALLELTNAILAALRQIPPAETTGWQ